ncbi:PREDICTED: CASP-like protein 2B1 [Nelumbo nucifera]|uniref:CASP-like protein n=1 Tax=Nelumbo nucifera TaxID=4432 RepID=A0A1U8Q1N2_NELNU|nr:PREDICTED: CASP-like protein 2B1 [Nelumbo nucifera]
MTSGGDVTVSPGNVPVYHKNNLEVIDRRVKVAEVVLRCMICGLGILAAVLVGSDTQVREIFTIRKKAKFTDMKALVFLLIANGIAAGYSFIQSLRCVVSVIRGSLLVNKPLAWAIFSGDQVSHLCLRLRLSCFTLRVMAYVLMAAFAAAAQSSVIAEMGQPEWQWMKVCNLYEKFCTQAGEGMVIALVVSLSMITLSFISAFNLFRLYGETEAQNRGGW